MNSFIIYETKNKNNKKVAEAVGSALDIPVADIADKPVLENIDFLFVVSGWYDGNSSGELICFLKEQKVGAIKHAATITLCHNYDLRQPQLKRVYDEKNIAYIGERICMNQFLFFGVGHPNKSDIQNIVDFLKETLGISKYD